MDQAVPKCQALAAYEHFDKVHPCSSQNIHRNKSWTEGIRTSTYNIAESVHFRSDGLCKRIANSGPFIFVSRNILVLPNFVSDL